MIIHEQLLLSFIECKSILLRKFGLFQNLEAPPEEDKHILKVKKIRNSQAQILTLKK